MNLLRQTTQVPPEMHGFLKDKNAWENAISMYQGPDPLDHWYNYICWYENHRHGDPENQYRQTLERCLSIFEHTEYYKQDVRMVRLWLKYIDMQPNPLHFYQVLHTRGVGKQIAAFYISWASYYESVSALKEAEAVFNVAFKEKAQSYAELHHAHSKFLYAHSPNAAATPTAMQSAALPQSHTQQQQPEYHQHHQNTSHLNVQVQNYRSQIVYQQTNQQQLQVQQSQHQQQNVYQQNVNNYGHSIPNQPQAVQPQFQSTQQGTYLQHQLAQPHTPAINVPVEQQLPATSAQQQQQNQQQQHEQFYQSQQIQQRQQPRTPSAHGSQDLHTNQATQPAETATTPVPGIRLPKKFASFSRNNYETWKPALFLEEPEDPSRKCHYAKQQVYPEGSAIEFSPEELFAQTYLRRMQTHQAGAESEEHKSYVQIQSWSEPVVEPVVYEQQVQHDQFEAQQEARVFQQITTYNQEPPLQNAFATSGNNMYQLTDGASGVSDGQFVNNTSAVYQALNAEQEAEQEDFAGYEETTGEEEDEEDADCNDDDDDDAEDYYDNEDQMRQRQQTQHAATVVNTLDDLEDQIEASTIRFSMHSEHQGLQNKTIKIKFRKEPAAKNAVAGASSKSINGSYSAYSVSVQNVYQQQHQHLEQPLKSATNNAQSPKMRSNGHSFHPYMISQTSTPKSATSTVSAHRPHNRSKLKKVNKFPMPTGSSSNSSSTDNAAGGTAITMQNGGINSRSINSSFHNANFNDNANYSFSSAVALDNSNCSLTSAVDRLNFRDSTFYSTAVQTAKLNSTNNVDFSTYQENSYFATQHDTEAKERRLQKALTTISSHLEKPHLDPFNSELCRAFLTKLNFPNMATSGAAPASDDESETESSSGPYLKIVQTPLPKLSNARTLYLPEADNMQFNIDKEVGRGSYGSVYKATDANTGTVVALKYQKPPNTWEIYICDQVLKRIKTSNILPGLMDISTAIIAPNASLIATEFSPFGSLLDVNNKIRQNTTKVMHESLVMHFSSQICNIIHHLHQQKIIHADIKPDNFLLMRIPSTETSLPSLRLIDFGCAIDMTLFPEPDKQKFRKVIQTDGFTCIEMQEGRKWSYETDIFCIAGTIHVMLFGEYMQVQKRAGVWDIKQKLPRYLKKHVWTKFFGEVLNIKNNRLPNLNEFHEIFDEEASKMDSELQKQIRSLSNILYRR